MTNPSETRDSELVARLRSEAENARVGFDAGAEESIIPLLKRAADTIDRLTSSGEAVGWRWPHTNGGWNYWWGPTPPPYADRLEVKPQALYTHASPREGHVEVPVEQVRAIATELARQDAAAALPERDTIPQSMADPLIAVYQDRLARAIVAALPHNQGETKP